MPDTLIAFNLLLLLLPGLVTLKVREALAIVGKTSGFSRVVDALMFTLLNYALYFPIASMLRLERFTILRLEGSDATARIQPVTPDLPTLFLILGTSVGLGIFVGMGTDRDWFYKVKRWLALTRRPARIDVWADTFYEASTKWVRVHLTDGTQIIGWPFRYSDEPQRRQLLLRNVTMRLPDGTIHEVAGPGLLLTEESRIKLIEFVD